MYLDQVKYIYIYMLNITFEDTIFVHCLNKLAIQMSLEKTETTVIIKDENVAQSSYHHYSAVSFSIKSPTLIW